MKVLDITSILILGIILKNVHCFCPEVLSNTNNHYLNIKAVTGFNLSISIDPKFNRTLREKKFVIKATFYDHNNTKIFSEYSNQRVEFQVRNLSEYCKPSIKFSSCLDKEFDKKFQSTDVCNQTKDLNICSRLKNYSDCYLSILLSDNQNKRQLLNPLRIQIGFDNQTAKKDVGFNLVLTKKGFRFKIDTGYIYTDAEEEIPRTTLDQNTTSLIILSNRTSINQTNLEPDFITEPINTTLSIDQNVTEEISLSEKDNHDLETESPKIFGPFPVDFKTGKEKPFDLGIFLIVNVAVIDIIMLVSMVVFEIVKTQRLARGKISSWNLDSNHGVKFA